jgi:hypothetical protein
LYPVKELIIDKLSSDSGDCQPCIQPSMSQPLCHGSKEIPALVHFYRLEKFRFELL